MEDTHQDQWLEVFDKSIYETEQSLYWQQQGQFWRTQPEITQQRQIQLKQRLAISSDIRKSIFPLKDIEPKLIRADIEWMLSLSENDQSISEQNVFNHPGHKHLDMYGVDLHGIDLSFLPLSHVRFGPHLYEWEHLTAEQKELAAAHLEGCNLYKASLEKAYLCGVHLDHADLRYAQMQGAHIRGATLSYAILSHSHLERTNLANSCLQHTDVRKAFLQGANLNDALLEGANFSEARLDGAELRNIKATGTNFRFAHFEKADLSGSMLAKTYLHDAHFENTNLRRVHFEEANLTLARLNEADLTNAHLERANISGAYCEKAVFAGAHFEDTDCHNVNLAGAVLCRASFSQGTQLDNVVLTKKGIGPASFADIHWNNVNLAGIQWSQLHHIGDEKEFSPQTVSTSAMHKESQQEYQEQLMTAIRTYRQLALALQHQGMYEEANRFHYRAHVVKCTLLRKQQPQNLIPYVTSLLFELVCGYGYKLKRTIFVYILINALWTFLYHLSPPYLSWTAALLFSFLSFHGKGLFEATSSINQEQLALATIETIIGTLYEVLFVLAIIKYVKIKEVQ